MNQRKITIEKDLDIPNRRQTRCSLYFRLEIQAITKNIMLGGIDTVLTFNIFTRSVVLAFVLVTFSISASAQTGIRALPAGKSAIGLGLQYYDPPPQIQQSRGNYQYRFRARNIRASLDYHFSRELKVSFISGIAFLNIASRDSVEVPPSPSAELRLTSSGPLGSMRSLDYFAKGGFRTHYTQVHSGGRALHYVNMTLTGGLGVIHRLNTVTAWKFNPFFGVFYSNIWRNASTTREILVDDTHSLFTGEAGIEIETSPTTNIIGSVEFSFETSEIIYNVGISFR